LAYNGQLFRRYLKTDQKTIAAVARKGRLQRPLQPSSKLPMFLQRKTDAQKELPQPPWTLSPHSPTTAATKGKFQRQVQLRLQRAFQSVLQQKRLVDCNTLPKETSTQIRDRACEQTNQDDAVRQQGFKEECS
jgi:hypothetical protein